VQPTAAPRDTVRLIRTDATDEVAGHLLLDSIVVESRNIHIVVNTVGGYLPRKPLREVTVQEWDLMINIKLKSAFLPTREALR